MSPTASNEPSESGLRRVLGAGDTASFIVGTVIGSGIFLVPSEIARVITGRGPTLALWMVGGLITLLGVLSLAELAAAIPAPGGIYTFLVRAYGEPVGFLCGWAIFTVITSGAIATLAVAFSITLGRLVPLTHAGARAISIGAVLVLTGINVLGVRVGAGVQNALTALKVAGLAVMAGAIFLLTPKSIPSPSVAAAATAEGVTPIAAFGLAMIAILWAYEGWHDASFIAGEVRDPQHIFPRGIVIGTLVIVALYLAVNLAYLRILSPEEIAGSPLVALSAVERAFGAGGARILTAVIVGSILGAMNGSVLAGPRCYFQMARDGLLPARLGEVHPRYHTPAKAIALQGVWSCVLILLIGGFSQLFTYVVFGGWIFYGLAVGAVVVLRRTEPDLPRPFRVPGFPAVPLIFIAAAFALVANTLVSNPRESAFGLAFIALGIPVDLARRAVARRRAAAGRFR
jgi:APA family basic amino acid/polyamine antiporter